LPRGWRFPELQGDVSFQSVYFRYGGEDTPYVLENISLDIKPGELVAIVGRSGSGKNDAGETAGRVLSAQRGQTEHRRLRHQRDRQGVLPRARSAMSCRPTCLFSGTIAENIAGGSDEPDRRRIEEVAKKADAHGFISKMPLGYQQIVGERGMGLSADRSSACALPGHCTGNLVCWCFDEATSALDSQSESEIIANMNDILKGRTAVGHCASPEHHHARRQDSRAV